jgi:predicted PurR-regulated permease PerM
MPSQAPNWTARLVGVAAAILFVAILALTVHVLLVPLVAAMFLVYLFEPGIEVLQRRGLERGRAYLLLFAITVIGIVGFFKVAESWLQWDDVSGSTETLSVRLNTQLDKLEEWTNTQVPMLSSIDVSGKIAERATEAAQQVLLQLPSIATSLVANLILVPFIGYFMVRDGRSLRRRIVAMVPNRYFEMTLLMFHKIDNQIGGYFRGRLIECLLVTVTQILLMGIASYYADQPQILLISVVGGVTNLIPYAGPVLGAAFGVFYYFAIGLELQSIWVLLAVIAIAHLIDNVVIAPAVLSHNVDLHPMTVALVLIIGGEVLGVLGLLIAIPVASSIKVVTQAFYTHYQAQVR